MLLLDMQNIPRLHDDDRRKNGGCRIEEARQFLPGRRASPCAAHLLPVKLVDLQRVARVLHPLVFPLRARA